MISGRLWEAVEEYLYDEEAYSDVERALFFYVVTKLDYDSLLDALEHFGYSDGIDETFYEAMRDIVHEYKIKRIIENLYECGDYEFWIFDDEDDAYETAVEDLENLFEGDFGVALSVNGYEQFIENLWFDEFLEESMTEWVQNADDDEFFEDCRDYELVDEDDFDEEGNYIGEETRDTLEQDLIDCHVKDAGDAIDYYETNVGHDALIEVVEQEGLLDLKELAEYCVRADGIAHTLASYDGNEVDFDYDGMTYLIYRRN